MHPSVFEDIATEHDFLIYHSHYCYRRWSSLCPHLLFILAVQQLSLSYAEQKWQQQQHITKFLKKIWNWKKNTVLKFFLFWSHVIYLIGVSLLVENLVGTNCLHVCRGSSISFGNKICWAKSVPFSESKLSWHHQNCCRWWKVWNLSFISTRTVHVVGRLRGMSADNIHIQTVKAIMYQLVKVHFSFVVSPATKRMWDT